MRPGSVQLFGLLQQLAQFPLQGGQVQAPFTPAARIDLAQQPQPVGLQLGHQGGAAVGGGFHGLAIGLGHPGGVDSGIGRGQRGHHVREDWTMQALFSPASLVTVAGALLSTIGWIGYATGNPNLSLPTIFYGIPILLGGLALKSSELPPAERLSPPELHRSLRELDESAPLAKVLTDVVRWRYGQKAHLESSLEVLKLWDQDQPPQLLSIEELDCDGRYGLRLNFLTAGVPLERWQSQRHRLGRFFGPGLRAEIQPQGAGRLLLELLPALPAEPEPPTGVSPGAEAEPTGAQG